MRRLLPVVAILVISAYGNWEAETLAAAPGLYPVISMALDSADNPHLAIGALDMNLGWHYAVRTDDTWSIIHHHTEGHVNPIMLRLDSRGLPHVVYTEASHPLIYAYSDGDTWYSEVVSSPGCRALGLVLGRDDTPHIMFRDSLQRYAHKTGDTWNILTVPVEQSDTLRRPHWSGGSFVLDSADRPAIAMSWVKYGHTDSIWLAVFEYDGRDWHRFDVDSGSGWATYDFWQPRIQYDPATDLFHITYRASVYSGHYVIGRHDDWLVEKNLPVSVGNWWYDFVLDQGRPHIICASVMRPFVYQWRSDGTWNEEPIIDITATTTSLAVDRTGRPHVAVGTMDGELIYARRRDVGIEEPDRPASRLLARGPTIVRGVLRLDAGLGHDPNCPSAIQSCPAPVLLDASGRTVMDLQPGENDIRHLSPGVYFIRAERVGVRGQETRKVVIQR